MCCNIRKRRKLLGEEQKLREQEEIIFKLFERQPNWSLRNLIQETDQPEVCATAALTNIFLSKSSFSLSTFTNCIEHLN
jgi:hypothetical protein